MYSHRDLLLHCIHDILQLDWTSCADTNKINLPQDEEGYDRFEYSDEKLSTRRIQWCGVCILFFWGVVLKK